MLENAVMITAGSEGRAVVLLERRCALERPAQEVSTAVLRATAHGIYEVEINGAPVTDSVLNPGWTAYEWRLQVQEFDVLDRVRAADGGGLELSVRLAGGWYRGDLGFAGAEANYGDDIGFLGELEITYADGTRQLVVTDTDWAGRVSDSPMASLYDGQHIDSRLRRADTPSLPVRAVEMDRGTLVAQVGPPIMRQEIIEPVRVWLSPSGRTLVDFGQNLVGWLRVRVPAGRGAPGDTITVRHAEVLEHDELGTRPLRGAAATDVFTLSGADEHVFEPTMTFHGFRYAEITGFPGGLTPDDRCVQAVVVHSQMRRTGWFECSDPEVEQLVSNSVWGEKGNFLDIPTDCPQRDERLGWTGDIAVYAPTACYQFDTADFLHKWLLDLAEETRHNPRGYVPIVIPDVLKYANFKTLEIDLNDDAFRGATAIWGDAAVWVPEALWNSYGDLDRLRAHYPGMVMHLESAQAKVSENGLWDTGFQFGDWLDPDAPPDAPAQAKADPGVVATACLYRSARFAADAAALLGVDADVERWAALAERTRAAFVANYVSPDGLIRSDCATVYALAIHFGLLDESGRRRAADRLVAVVRERGYRVSTGFAGTPFVTWALSETGHVEDAYRLLLERGNPSWLYPVTMGATTIWERWDSMLEDGTINPGEMTSFNHYALGAVADWIYQVVAGIRPAGPGYSTVRFAPRPGPGLDWARGRLDSPHGRIECGWRREADRIVVEVLVPDGVAAELVAPDGTSRPVSAGEHAFTW